MRIILSALLAWAIAQGIKVLIAFGKTRKWDRSLLTASGGMPSSHTALVVATSCRVGLIEGVSSTAFAVCVVRSLIVMYDAVNVRRAVGVQARKLNQMLDTFRERGSLDEEGVKEILGHTPLQVAVGFLIGLMVGLVEL